MKVVWSDTAKRQLLAIRSYIAQSSERYAMRMVDRITSRSGQIGQFPRSGRVVPEFSTDSIRELFEGPYRIIYEIREGAIVIAAVVHTASNTGWR